MHCFQELHYWLEKPKQIPFLDYSDRFIVVDTEYILNYTSNVIKITQGGSNYFFKEAKRRPVSISACVYDGINEFFEEIVPHPALKQRTLDVLNEKKHFNRLINMGYKNNSSDRLHRYIVSGNEEYIGLPRATSEEEKILLKKLAFYLYGELQNWFYNAGVKTGELQTFSAVRALATSEIARIIGVDYLIPRCDFVRLEMHGKVRYGVLSEEAVGDALTSSPIDQRFVRVTPDLLRSLTDLNLLDVITRDNDHRVGNYYVVLDDFRKYVSILSYDNDNPDAFRLSSSISYPNLIGCSGFVNKKGLVNRAHLNKNPALALITIEKTHLSALSPYLNDLQLWFLWLRICRVKSAIKKSICFHSDFLLEEADWTKDHINQDLSGDYGKTYLASLLSDCYYETGLHPYDTL